MYLFYLFTMMPGIDFKNNPALLEEFMPWSAKLPDYFLCIYYHTFVITIIFENPIKLAEACGNRTHPPQDHYGADWI
jgi:hypothetical protein